MPGMCIVTVEFEPYSNEVTVVLPKLVTVEQVAGPEGCANALELVLYR